MKKIFRVRYHYKTRNWRGKEDYDLSLTNRTYVADTEAEAEQRFIAEMGDGGDNWDRWSKSGGKIIEVGCYTQDFTNQLTMEDLMERLTADDLIIFLKDRGISLKL